MIMCDRCGNEVSKILPKYHIVRRSNIVLRSNFSYLFCDVETVNLCNDCQKKLDEWLEGKKDEEYG